MSSDVDRALPPGIALRSDLPFAEFAPTASAALVGVATTPGTYNFTLRVSSGGQNSDLVATMKVTNLPEANKYLSKAYRKGWEV